MDRLPAVFLSSVSVEEIRELEVLEIIKRHVFSGSGVQMAASRLTDVDLWAANLTGANMDEVF